MHAEYCDRIYQYDHDFSKDNKRLKVLVIGNSFARDWGNILFESEMKDKIELSDIYTNNARNKLSEHTHLARIKDSDYIFIFAQKAAVPDYLWKNARNIDNIYGIGTKKLWSEQRSNLPAQKRARLL